MIAPYVLIIMAFVSPDGGAHVREVQFNSQAACEAAAKAVKAAVPWGLPKVYAVCAPLN